MTLEISGTILYVAKILYQSNNRFENWQGNKMVHSSVITNCRGVIISRLSQNTLLCNTLHTDSALHMGFNFYFLLNLRTICPPLWDRWQHARLSRSGPGFEPWSGQVSWVRFFRGFSSPVRQMSGSFRSLRSPNIIWPSLPSSIIIHTDANDLSC